MARRIYEETKIAAIAEKIREKTGGDTTYTTAEMSEGVSEVYEAGKKAEYDVFWDDFQQNGDRTNYGNTFSYRGWTDNNFKPKYDITPSGSAQYMFSNSAMNNIADSLEKQCVIFDTSKATSFNYMFSSALSTVIPVLDCSSGTSFTQVFNSSYLKTIKGIVLKDDGSQNISGMFGNNCRNLENLTVSGTIGSDIDISVATQLTLESAASIITHLKDYSGTADAGKYTLSLADSVWASLDADEGYREEYTEYYLSGTWAWEDNETMHEAFFDENGFDRIPAFSQDINFESGDPSQQFTNINWAGGGLSYNHIFVWSDGWTGELGIFGKLVKFGSTPQQVSKEFFDIFTATATGQEGNAIAETKYNIIPWREYVSRKGWKTE